MSLLGSYIKQPAETESYSINYEDDLTAGDNVSSAVATVSPAGLTIQSVVADDPRVRLWILGGTANVTYKVTVTMTTVDGRILQDEFRVKVKEI